MYCNPDVCPYCQYIGEGDSWCEETGEIVLSTGSRPRGLWVLGVPI